MSQRYSAAIDTAAGAGLFNRYSTQQRQLRLKLLPDPQRHVFTGRVFQTGNIIEVMVVELIIDWRKGLFDITKVHNPARIAPPQGPQHGSKPKKNAREDESICVPQEHLASDERPRY